MKHLKPGSYLVSLRNRTDIGHVLVTDDEHEALTEMKRLRDAGYCGASLWRIDAGPAFVGLHRGSGN